MPNGTGQQCPASGRDAAAARSGTSGGGRVLIALRAGERAVLMFAWEKKDMENIKPDELKEYRDLAKIYLGFTELQMDELARKKVVVEIVQHR